MVSSKKTPVLRAESDITIFKRGTGYGSKNLVNILKK